MRYVIIFMLVAFAACGGAGKGSIRKQLTGNWFIVYPNDELRTDAEEKAYARVQDSLVNLKGVKLVSLLENGTFIQWDSTVMKGKWGTDGNEVVVSKAGKGFENFKTTYEEFKDGVLKLTEYVNADGEKLKLVWHLKKITGGKEASLFDPEKNAWRQAPVQEETEPALKKRLSEMLAYYAIYFKLISEESSYFMPMRVMLPVKFYQHAIGMKEYDEGHRFTSLFNSKEQAKKAFDLLKEAVNKTTFDLPDNDSNSYSLEYSQMLEILSREILK